MGTDLMTAKILVISNRDIGGDGFVAYRIAKALKEFGYEVALLVRDREQWQEPFVHQFHREAPKTPKLPVRVYKKVLNRLFPAAPEPLIHFKRYYDFSAHAETRQYATADEILNSIPFVPDLVFNTLTSGFVNSRTLLELETKTRAKIYLLSIDMAPLTGGCHHS